VDTYAAELRRSAHELPRGKGDAAALVDRLLVGALIEARSCERFKLLADATAGLPERGAEHALWTELLAAEARHYRTFVDLAVDAAGGDRPGVEARLHSQAGAEGANVQRLAAAGASRATNHG
jgi:tRNA-(ms[2]io[6]A)-hydroxylase